MHFVCGTVFISSSESMQIGLNTMDVAQSSMLAYTPPGGLTGDVTVDTCMVLHAILGFIILLGWIAFFRGWFMLKAAVEGSHQAMSSK